ncbi:MAG: WG repeat-containing protein [Leptolyngbya sp.]|nr:WG repeat-containing protein [Candidatus Melainabacteria bacterium]
MNSDCALAQSFLKLIRGIQDASKFKTTNLKPVKKAELNALVGYINTSGQFVIPPHFYRGEQFTEGRAAVTCLDERAAFIDEAGKYMVGPFEGTAYSYKSGLAVLKLYGGLDNTSKRFVFLPDPRRFNQAERLKYNSPSAYGQYIAVIDKSGKWVIAPFQNPQKAYPLNIGKGLILQSDMTCTRAK